MAPSEPTEILLLKQAGLQLPPDWVVISNVSWTQRMKPWEGTGAAYVRDGQADFVILAPGLGMLVVEVKGSRSIRILPNGTWVRSEMRAGQEIEVPVVPAPPQQATKNMHHLARQACEHFGWAQFPGLFGYVVAYPHGAMKSSGASLQDPSTLLLSHQMSDLESRFRHALLARGPTSVGSSFTREVCDQLSEFLVGHPFEIVRDVGSAEISDDLDRIETLTRQQFAALQGLFAYPNVAVTGPAGSGKTLLAVWRLASLVAEGKNAILVCYNTRLAEHLRLRNLDLSDRIHSVDSLFWEIASKAGVRPILPANKTHFFAEELPGVVLDIASLWGEERKYCDVIVDEGQDFSDAQLIALLEVKQATGTYAFFCDWRQDLYRRSTSGAIGAEVFFGLHHNCRNTVLNNEATNGLTGKFVPPMPGLPEGVEPTVVPASSPRELALKAWELAKKWRGPDQRLAILSPWTLERSSMAALPAMHGLKLVTELADWTSAETVLFSTIKSFKGLEASCVIATDLEIPQAGGPFSEEDLYVACTRSTSRLALLTQKPEAHTWLTDRIRARMRPASAAKVARR